MPTLWEDLPYALRRLRKAPAFTALAAGTIGLGIGVTTAMFTIVNGVLLSPLPYGDPERLVFVAETNGRATAAAVPAYLDWRDHSQALQELAAEQSVRLTLTQPGEEPLELQGGAVTPNYFATLGVPPVLGRGFQPEEAEPGADGVVVLSYDFWSRQFAADRALVGKLIPIDGRARTVVGVMPREFRSLPLARDIYVPRVISPGDRTNLTMALSLVGRLKPGVSLEEARTDLARVAALTAERFPQRGPWKTVVMPLHERVVGAARSVLLLLFGATGFVLLVACANITSLMLARTTAQRHEVALRLALGAGRARVRRQLLTEAVVLGLLGGAVGLLLAHAAMRVLVALNPGNVPRLDTIVIDPRVGAFTAVVSLAAGLVLGLIPMLRLGEVDLLESIKGSGARVSGSGRRGVREVLIAVESALVLLLLAGAGLMVKSYRRTLEVDLGVRTEDRLVVEITLPQSKYADEPAVGSFFRDLSDRTAAIPGVRAVGTATAVPPDPTMWNYLFFQGRPVPPDDEVPLTDVSLATSDHVQAAGMTLLRGRGFTRVEEETSADVAMINETLARRFFPGQDPIGSGINFNPEKAWFRIVGIVGNAKFGGVTNEDRPHVYVPNLKFGLPWHVPTRKLVVRVSPGTAAPVTSAVRSAVAAIDRAQPITRIESYDEMIARSLTRPRFSTVLFGVFGGVALLLGSVGIYGVVNYAASQRVRELGIRRALGAQSSAILGLMMGAGLVPVLIGIGLGLGAAVGLARLMRGMLFQVSPTDPVALGAVSLLLLAVAAMASFLPALRASRADPMLALRDG